MLFRSTGKNFQEGGFFRGQRGERIGLSRTEGSAFLLQQRHERSHRDEFFRSRSGETAGVRTRLGLGMPHFAYRL